MKIGIADHISIFPFLFFELGKRKRKLDYPIFIFHYGIGERKTKGRYIQHVAVFRLSCFHLTKEKNENGYNRSYFYFSFFVWWLQKRKRMLCYSLSIFYYEIEKNEKRKDGIYTDRVSPLYPLRPVVVCGISLGLILSMIQMYLSPNHMWQLHTIIYRIVWTALVAQPIWPEHT